MNRVTLITVTCSPLAASSEGIPIMRVLDVASEVIPIKTGGPADVVEPFLPPTRIGVDARILVLGPSCCAREAMICAASGTLAYLDDWLDRTDEGHHPRRWRPGHVVDVLEMMGGCNP